MIRFVKFTDQDTGVVTKKVEANGLKSIAIQTFLVRTQPHESLSLLQMVYDVEAELKNDNQLVERLVSSLYADCSVKTSTKKVLKGELSLSEQKPLEEDREYLRIDSITINPTATICEKIEKLVDKKLGLSE